MKIGIIGGTGPQGLGIAKRLAIAGEDVIVGSRKEEKALTVVEEANEEIKEYNPKELVGMANEDAAAAADVLILTVPLQAQSATLKTIKEHTKGKVLLDATVPLETAIGGPVSNVLHINPGSAAERAANILKDADVKVVAAFNNISNSHLANIPNPIECDCLICGDDGKAKEIASDIIEKIPGLKAIDIGPLNKAHLIESITPLLIGMLGFNKTAVVIGDSLFAVFRHLCFNDFVRYAPHPFKVGFRNKHTANRRRSSINKHLSKIIVFTIRQRKIIRPQTTRINIIRILHPFHVQNHNYANR